MFSYYHEEDESSFQLVDTSRPQRPLYQRNRNRFGQVSQCLIGIPFIASLWDTGYAQVILRF